MTMETIFPSFGHELNAPPFRGRVYDAMTHRILDRNEVLAAFDAGTLTAKVSVPKRVHPSYHTRQTASGGGYIDAAEYLHEMTRDELVAMFAREAK